MSGRSKKTWPRALGPPLLGDQDIHGVEGGTLLERAAGLGDAEPGREQAWGEPEEQSINNSYRQALR